MVIRIEGLAGKVIYFCKKGRLNITFQKWQSLDHFVLYIKEHSYGKLYAKTQNSNTCEFIFSV